MIINQTVRIYIQNQQQNKFHEMLSPRPTTSRQIIPRCANVTFRSDINTQTIKKCLQSLKRTKFDKKIPSKQWQFNFEQYSKMGLDELLKISSKLLINFFSLHFCKQKNILKDINHIEFSQLTYLYLDGNKIISVQCLSTLNAPELKTISLGRNNIVSLRGLQRSYFSKLIFLQLSQIKIPCLESFFNNAYLAKIQTCYMIPSSKMVNWQNLVKMDMKDRKKLRFYMYNALEPVHVASKFMKIKPNAQFELDIRIYEHY